MLIDQYVYLQEQLLAFAASITYKFDSSNNK